MFDPFASSFRLKGSDFVSIVLNKCRSNSNPNMIAKPLAIQGVSIKSDRITVERRLSIGIILCYSKELIALELFTN